MFCSILSGEKPHYRYFPGNTQKGKDVLKFQHFQKKSLQRGPFSLMVPAYSSGFSAYQKSITKNVSCECSKLVGKLPVESLYWSHAIKVTRLVSRIYILHKSHPESLHMTVSMFQWRSVIGIFNCPCSAMSYRVCNLIKNFVSFFEILLFGWHYFESAFNILLSLIYNYSFLQCHGDIELNPGPRKLKTNSFSICHWNLNSLATYNFSKLTQLIAYNSIYKHDFICL